MNNSVLVGIGVEVTMEVLAAARLLYKLCPELRVRVVNVTDLMILSPYGEHPHALSAKAFDSLFTKDKPIHFNYVRVPARHKIYLSDLPLLALLSHRIERTPVRSAWPEPSHNRRLQGGGYNNDTIRRELIRGSTWPINHNVSNSDDVVKPCFSFPCSCCGD